MLILSYLDDWFVVSQTETDSFRDLAPLISHTARLGLRVTHEKSTFKPSQRIAFIGIQLDSQGRKATPAPQRVNDILSRVEQFRRGQVRTFSSFQVLLGTLTAAAAIVPLGLLSLRPLQMWINRLGIGSRERQAQAGKYHCQVCSVHKAMEELGILDSGSSPWRHTPLQGGRNDRRFSDRLGCCLAVQGCSQLVGPPTAAPTHKCVRAVSLFSLPSSGSFQCNHWEYEVSVIPETSSPVAGLPPLAEPEGYALSGHSEHSSRLLVPTEPSCRGVEAAPGGGAGIWQRYGRGGSLRLQRLYTLPLWFSLEETTSPFRPGFAVTQVAPAAFVCISPTCTDSSHSPQDLPGGLHGAADSSQMAREAVVSSVAQTIGQTPLAPPHSFHNWGDRSGTSIPARLQLWVWPLQGRSLC